MAIAVQSSSSANPAIGTSTTITKPTGVVEGDYLFAAIGFEDAGSATINSVPSGWTLIDSTQPASNVNLFTYFKVAGGSEPADYTWGIDDTQRIGGSMLRIDGQSEDSGGALDQNNEGDQSNDDTPSFATGITPSEPSSLILMATCSKQNGDTAHSNHAITTSNPSWTVEQGTPGGGVTISIAYAVRPETTSTGAWSLTAGSNGDATDSASQLISITAQVNASVTLDAPDVNLTPLTLGVTGSANVTLDTPDIDLTPNNITATGSASKFTNKNKSSAPTWVNKDKS